MYITSIYVRIWINIRVFGGNALTQDKEVTNKYILIYKRIQAIRAYTCKKKPGHRIPALYGRIRNIQAIRVKRLYTDIYMQYDQYVRIRNLHAIRAIRTYTYIL